jgi:diguanylate cyclase (GGDEF)-like protein
VISLKLKLVAYFLVLSTLPLAAAYWGFSSSISGNESRRADERLSAELRAASYAYHGEVAAARAEAIRAGNAPGLQEALEARDITAIRAIVDAHPGVRIRFAGTSVGPKGAAAPVARITVRDEAGVLGEVIGVVAANDELAARLRAHAGLRSRDSLVVAVGDRIATGPGKGQPVGSLRGAGPEVELGGTEYYAVTSPGAVTIGIVTPLAPIQAATADARKQLLIGVLVSLLLIALVAYVEGAAIVRTLRRFVFGAQAIAQGHLEERVPVRSRDEFGQLGKAFNKMAAELEGQRNRLRQATLRFGEALAATHDIDQLLRVIVTTAVESSRAKGGVIRVDTGELARAGTPDEDCEQIEVPIAVGGESFGTLVLYGEAFDEHDREMVGALATHALTALENARLHELIKRQALLDSLTGMSNRRQCESVLGSELARAVRFGNPLAFVLADLDGFKSVNDGHGHLAGDEVLREFSAVLRELVRETDVAARWGGDEFALVLPNTNAEGAAQLVERIRSTLEQRRIRIGDQRIGITASFGVAVYPAEGSSERLIQAADDALYAAKRAGKNRLETADPLALTA